MEEILTGGTKGPAALVVVNGELPAREILDPLVQSAIVVVCTDGAAEEVLNHGINPTTVIGDLDSLSTHLHEKLGKEGKLVERPSQYATDFEKALDHVAGLGIERVFLVGIKGGRFDHAYTNLSILRKNIGRFDFTLFDDDGVGVVCCDDAPAVELGVLPLGTTVSLLPLPRAKGVRTQGLRYELNSEMLELGVREGQSNEVLSSDSPVRISITAGALIVFVLRRAFG